MELPHGEEIGCHYLLKIQVYSFYFTWLHFRIGTFGSLREEIWHWLEFYVGQKGIISLHYVNFAKKECLNLKLMKHTSFVKSGQGSVDWGEGIVFVWWSGDFQENLLKVFRLFSWMAWSSMECCLFFVSFRNR
jgi:hypothetical protein